MGWEEGEADWQTERLALASRVTISPALGEGLVLLTAGQVGVGSCLPAGTCLPPATSGSGTCLPLQPGS